jgi:hypothetical protein
VIECRNQIIAECPIDCVRSVARKARLTHERSTRRHQPERRGWTEGVVERAGERSEVLTCAVDLQTMGTMGGCESGGEDYGLSATATAALLSAADDEWLHLRLWTADQRGNTERAANLG